MFSLLVKFYVLVNGANPAILSHEEREEDVESCWKELSRPQREPILPQVHNSKPKLSPFSGPLMFLWPETQDILSISPQTPSHLWAFSPQTSVTMWPQPIRYFLFVSSLFFILHRIKASWFQPHFAVLWKEPVHFMKSSVKFVGIT